MSSIITDTIRHLLMEEDQVCLPGVGTLRLQQQAALISQLEGKAIPPSELVIFNANLVLDDGRILRELEHAGQLSREEATALLDEFLRNLRENLDAGRSVILDGIGRLFKQHDGQLKFTPTGDNFSKASFGLPSIDIRPIIRTEKQRRAAADPMLVQSTGNLTPETGVARERRRDKILYHPELRQALWYVTGFLAILLLLGAVYQIAQFSGRQLTDDPSAPVNNNREQTRIELPSDRINVAPGPKPVDADSVRPDDPPRLSDPVVSPPPINTAPATTPDAPDAPATSSDPPATTTRPATGDNVALIATGLFGSQRNVEKNTDRINAAGFTTFARPEGRLTRIGARIEYSSPTELQNALERLQRIFSDAYVMEINGEMQRE